MQMEDAPAHRHMQARDSSALNSRVSNMDLNLFGTKSFWVASLIWSSDLEMELKSSGWLCTW